MFKMTLNELRIGKGCLKKFVEERLISKEVPFYDPIEKNKLKTFTSMQVKITMKAKGKEIILKADRNIFSGLLVIHEKRGISLSDVLKFSLGPVAWSLANVDGTIFKTVKSRLFDEIEKDLKHTTESVSSGIYIYDRMCLIQQLQQPLNTFGDVSDTILRRITSNNVSRIFFVTDQYLDGSIKSCERDNRAKVGSIRISAQRRNQKVPKQLKKFLSVGENKIDLVRFLLKDWSQEMKHVETISGKEIYITVEKQGYKIEVKNGHLCCSEIQALCSLQEEADTKMFLAAQLPLLLEKPK